MNGMKFVSARYYNSNRSTAEVKWLDSNEKEVVMYFEVSLNNAGWNEVLKHTTLEEIEANTQSVIKAEREAFIATVKDIAMNEGLLANETQGIISLFDVIANIENDKEQMFKLKLEIFERPEVKNSKNRTWKSKMRKSTSVLELLSLLHIGPADQESAPSESQD